MSEAQKTTLVKKITMSEVGGIARNSGGFKPKRDFGADENGHFAPRLLMRVLGVVVDYKLGTTTYGEFIKFAGNFAAINSEGAKFRSNALILPGPADTLTLDAFKAGEGSPIELAFDIMVIPDGGERGYKFQVQPLMEQKQADPLAQLENQVASRFALPLPVVNQPLLPGVSDGGTVAEDSAPTETAAAEKPSGKKTK